MRVNVPSVESEKDKVIMEDRGSTDTPHVSIVTEQFRFSNIITTDKNKMFPTSLFLADHFI
jgi:hypothetical protein